MQDAYEIHLLSEVGAHVRHFTALTEEESLRQDCFLAAVFDPTGDYPKCKQLKENDKLLRNRR